jgi:hypothetical protein
MGVTDPEVAPASIRTAPAGWAGGPDSAGRVVIALTVGAIAAVMVWLAYRGHSDAVSDWDQCWLAARALLQGKSPYAAVNADTSPWPLIYPLPAVLVSLPFALVPLPLARALFAGVSSGLLAYALSPRWLTLLPFISGAYVWALFAVQWVPLLVAAVLLPWLGFVLIVKPTTGLALGLGWPSWWAIIGAALLLAVSFAVDPAWLAHWRAGVGSKIVYHVPPVMRPFGWLLLLALLWWRRPEGRFLVASALIPQAAMPSDLLALLLIPQTFVERAIFVATTQLLALYGLKLHEASPSVFAHKIWPATLVLGYLPALIMVLRRPRIPGPARIREEDGAGGRAN